MELRALSVTEINNYITNVFYAEEMLQNVKIFGEVTGFGVVRGNAYFALKDENNLLNCVYFGISNPNIKNGDEVMLAGDVRFYGKQGKLQFYANSIVPYGQGILYQKFLELKERLSKEGLFDAVHKKPLPEEINNIGVITSPTGAVKEDIITIVSRRNPFCNIYIYPAKVQGIGAEQTVIEGLEYFNKAKTVDVIIIARGGGSFEDLNCFNSESLARSIYASDIMVVSGVGHDPDFTICDFVSDLRAPTPSAAAELVTRDVSGLLLGINDNIKRMFMNLNRKNESYLNFADDSTNKLLYYMQNLTGSKQHILELITSRLNNNNPLSILERGYAKLFKQGRAVNSIEQVNLGDELLINLKDGELKAQVKEKKKMNIE